MKKDGTPMTEDVVCPLSCKKNDEIVFVGRDMLHDLPGEFTVVKCNNCGLLRTNPRPTPEAIGNYYPDDYGPYLGTQVQQSSPNVLSTVKRFLKPLVNFFLNFNTQRIPQVVPGRLLEVGCASGAFLHKMKNEGWQVQGIEFSDKAAEATAKLGYQVYTGALESAPKSDKPFDLIVGWMVLEHLHDPIAGLTKLRECAKPDSWLVLSVPNAGAFEFRLFKDKCYDLHLPNHLFHYTQVTLKKVLNASGWNLEKVYHQRVLSNLIASMGYVLRGKGYVKLGQKLTSYPEKAGIWNYLLYPVALILSLFGQTGRMTVWARCKE